MQRPVLLAIAVMALLLATGTSPLAGDAAMDPVRAKIRSLGLKALGSAQGISAERLKQLLDQGTGGFILLDVRDREEYEAGHIGGAVFCSRGRLEWLIADLVDDPGTPLFVYCRTGLRSALVVHRLKELGFTDARNLEGGFAQWAKRGYPVYNRHGAFVLLDHGFEREEPRILPKAEERR